MKTKVQTNDLFKLWMFVSSVFVPQGPRDWMPFETTVLSCKVELKTTYLTKYCV